MKAVTRVVSIDGPRCPFLTCLALGGHGHPVCPACGAVRMGNPECPACQYWHRFPKGPRGADPLTLHLS